MVARTKGEPTSDAEPDFVISILDQLSAPWMGGYFKPWRRRIGVLTLMVACAFAMAWTRSFQFDEAIGFNVLVRRHVFRSVEGHLIWESSVLTGSERDSWSLKPRWLSIPISQKPSVIIMSRYPMYRMVNMGGCRATVAYWGLVPSLTLLSAWLLLRKPRAEAEKLPTL